MCVWRKEVWRKKGFGGKEKFEVTGEKSLFVLQDRVSLQELLGIIMTMISVVSSKTFPPKLQKKKYKIPLFFCARCSAALMSAIHTKSNPSHRDHKKECQAQILQKLQCHAKTPFPPKNKDRYKTSRFICTNDQQKRSLSFSQNIHKEVCFFCFFFSPPLRRVRSSRSDKPAHHARGG